MQFSFFIFRRPAFYIYYGTLSFCFLSVFFLFVSIDAVFSKGSPLCGGGNGSSISEWTFVIRMMGHWRCGNGWNCQKKITNTNKTKKNESQTNKTGDGHWSEWARFFGCEWTCERISERVESSSRVKPTSVNMFSY